MKRTLSNLWKIICVMAQDARYFLRDWWNDTIDPNQDSNDDDDFPLPGSPS